ncbi:MAG: hypothetical protein KAR45_15540 [Desulfobacteraceae bacterium]|nr:hypothetical protein [Desulfobacteraceae bacterium]
MKFADFFLPKYLHSNPDVRLKLVAKTKDINLLEQMSEKDKDTAVREAAAERAQVLKREQILKGPAQRV